MDQQPKIPTLKDAQKPQVKIKGMGAGLTLFDRLKQFKKKDLAFILAGLGTLFMAPLAEHFMMAPENGDSSLKQGWGGPGSAGGNLFGSGSSPYENGNNNIASGGAIGGSGDIITPLNVRDPSALVMGPGGMQQPPAGSAAPAAPPPTAPSRNETDYKDALAGAASRAASAAVKKSPLPVPKVALGGSGLRGLGVAGGGTSASGSLGPINSGNLGQAGTGGGGLNMVRSAPGFRGAAGARGPNSPQGLDGTKRAGANAGDAFSRTGSALGGLNAAASEQIPTGGAGFGGGGQGGSGANDKPGGGTGPGGSKSVGESLAFIEAKERMMENLKLEFEKRKLKDPELLLYGIRNDSLKAMASEMTKSLTKGIIGFMDPSAASSSAYWECLPSYPKISNSTAPCDEKKKSDCMAKIRGEDHYQISEGNTVKCVSKNGADGSGKPKAETAPSSAGGVVSGQGPETGGREASTLGGFCKVIDGTIKDKPSATDIAQTKKWEMAGKLRPKIGAMISARDALYGVSTDNSCDAEKLRTDKSSYEYRGTAIAALLEEGGLFTNAGIPALVKLVPEAKGEIKDKAITEARKQYEEAVKIRQKASNKISEFSDAEALLTEAEALFKDPADKKFVYLFRDAKIANKAITDYNTAEEARLKDLGPLVTGAELAGDKAKKPTVAEVVSTNGSYAAMFERAKPFMGEKPAATGDKPAGDATGAAPDVTKPEDNAKEVMTKVEAARTAIGKSDAEGALKAVADMEAKKKEAEAAKPPTTYTPTDADKKPVVDAETALGEMQKQQYGVLSGISGKLTEMKKGTKPPETTVAQQ